MRGAVASGDDEAVVVTAEEVTREASKLGLDVLNLGEDLPRPPSLLLLLDPRFEDWGSGDETLAAAEEEEELGAGARFGCSAREGGRRR